MSYWAPGPFSPVTPLTGNSSLNDGVGQSSYTPEPTVKLKAEEQMDFLIDTVVPFSIIHSGDLSLRVTSHSIQLEFLGYEQLISLLISQSTPIPLGPFNTPSCLSNCSPANFHGRDLQSNISCCYTMLTKRSFYFPALRPSPKSLTFFTRNSSRFKFL